MPSLKPTRAARTFSVGITMLLMMIRAIRSTTAVAMIMATTMQIIAMLEIVLCRLMMVSCSDWSLAASSFPAVAI